MRVSKAPEERRAELVQAARTLFDQNGVDKTRVSDIVKKVGVAQGVFYYYFSSKEEIVDIVLRLVAEEMQQSLHEILQSEQSFCQKLAAYIELYIGMIDQFLGDDEKNLPPAQDYLLNSNPVALKWQSILEKHLNTLVKMGVQSGEVSAVYPFEMAQVLLFGLRQLATQRLPSRKMIYSMTEKSMGLPAGRLTKLLPAKKKKQAD